MNQIKHNRVVQNFGTTLSSSRILCPGYSRSSPQRRPFRSVHCKAGPQPFGANASNKTKIVPRSAANRENWMTEEMRYDYARSDNTYIFQRWDAHRSSQRYIRHMIGILQSNTLRGLAHPLLSVAGVATIICMYEDLLKDGAFPEYFSSFMMPPLPFELTVSALALLLVFRTQSSTDRWEQVSTVWSGLANRARDTMRQAISHLSDASGAMNPLAGAMCRWVVAYIRSLKAELVQGTDLEAELSSILTPEELTQLMAARHRPSFALSVLTEVAAMADLRESYRIRLDENLTFFEDAVGTCEFVLYNPVPLQYSRHTSRFMVIWLSALPLGLYESCGWATIPISVIIGFLLLGIDSIGVQLEFPFEYIPLAAICDEIEGDVYNVLREAVVTKRTATAAAASALGQQNSSAAPFSPLPNGSKEIVQSRWDWTDDEWNQKSPDPAAVARVSSKASPTEQE